jgi:ubiquinone/menaquinone biosynthesis C-methylase UbiE
VEERIRTVYAGRTDRERDQLSAGDQFIHEERDRAVAELIATAGIDLARSRILEVGCGDGRVLALFRELGADERLLAGIDLLPDRLAKAAAQLPAAELREGSATSLPWDDASFDLVLQFTMLSSVIEDDERARCCSEMRRVLKPGGVILSYDFTWNPLNRQTKGVSVDELRRQFPDAEITTRRLTLAPPLARAIAPLSAGAARTLAKLPFLRTHHLALLRLP